MNNHSDNLFDSQAPLDDEKLWDLLSLYVDGEADPAQAAIVEQMLSSDPAYRRDFDFLIQTSKTMHTQEEVAPPIGLRDAIYAGTARRSTLVGRLRAAWNRATTPAFGRYATVGGAFAVAAIGALLVLPRLHSTTTHEPTPNVVALSATAPHGTIIPISPIPEIVTIGSVPVKPNVQIPFKQSPPKSLVYHKLEIIPNVVPNVVKPLDRHVRQAATAGHGPRNHYLPKNNAPRPDSLQAEARPGYPYDKKMDNNTAPDHKATIVTPTGDDFGPMVATNDEPSTPHTIPTAGMGNTGDSFPPSSPQPKTTVHVATLPPGASQNIAAAVIRHNMTAKYSGYDRSVAENIQRHEVTIDVIKGTF